MRIFLKRARLPIFKQERIEICKYILWGRVFYLYGNRISHGMEFRCFFSSEKSSIYPLSAKLKVSLLLPVDVRLVFEVRALLKKETLFSLG